MSIYSNPKYLDVREEASRKCLVFSWTDFAIPLKELQKAHLTALEVLKAKKYRILIADTADVKGVLFAECIQWWEGEMIGKYLEAGVEYMFTVVPKSALGRISTKDWQKQIVGALTLLNLPSLSDAFAACDRVANNLKLDA